MLENDFELWDELIDSVKDEILSDESKTKLLNPLKMKEMQDRLNRIIQNELWQR